jgi:ubiquinone/menaquinone biosynthesis C-methylase UbiE
MAKQSKRQDLEERFLERYSAPTTDAALIVEREAIGANVGANGYTTVRQADLLAERLALEPRHLLLDIGSGRGWPGVYLAQRTGCGAVLMDVPPPALAAAMKRSEKEGVAERISVVRGSAMDLPLAASAFDAVSHTDSL